MMDEVAHVLLGSENCSFSLAMICEFIDNIRIINKEPLDALYSDERHTMQWVASNILGSINCVSVVVEERAENGGSVSMPFPEFYPISLSMFYPATLAVFCSPTKTFS